MSRQKIWDIILILFSAYWTIFFLLDYWDKHPNYVLGLQYFRYTKLCIFLVITGGAISYFITKFRSGLISKFYNGIAIYILGIICVIAISISYNKYLNLDLGVSNYLHLIGRLSINFFTGFFIILSSYSIGNIVLKKFLKNSIKYNHFTIDFGLGAIILTMVLFLLGALGQLKALILFPILLLFIAANWKGSLEFILTTFFRPIVIKTSNSFWGYFSLSILFFFLMLNFLAIDLPFPLGFDSRNLYINIAKQLGVTHHLVPGYQPYSWSLFISQGFVLFNKVETTLFLSFITGVLCLFSVFHLSHKYFGISFTNSSLLVLAAGVIPTFANQYFVELKTDFGLVLFQLLSIIILMEVYLKSKNTESKILGLKQKNFQLLLLLGLFIGFGLAIKLLNLFLIFAIVIAIWVSNGNTLGAIGLLLTMFALVLILGLTNISGLGRYHLGNNLGKWIYLLLGAVFLIFTFIKDKRGSILFIKKVTIVGSIALFPLLPWIGKNYLETRSLSPTKLLLGEPAGPNMNIFIIDREMNKN